MLFTLTLWILSVGCQICSYIVSTSEDSPRYPSIYHSYKTQSYWNIKNDIIFEVQTISLSIFFLACLGSFFATDQPRKHRRKSVKRLIKSKGSTIFNLIKSISISVVPYISVFSIIFAVTLLLQQ